MERGGRGVGREGGAGGSFQMRNVEGAMSMHAMTF